MYYRRDPLSAFAARASYETDIVQRRGVQFHKQIVTLGFSESNTSQKSVGSDSCSSTHRLPLISAVTRGSVTDSTYSIYCRMYLSIITQIQRRRGSRALEGWTQLAFRRPPQCDSARINVTPASFQMRATPASMRPSHQCGRPPHQCDPRPLPMGDLAPQCGRHINAGAPPHQCDPARPVASAASISGSRPHQCERPPPQCDPIHINAGAPPASMRRAHQCEQGPLNAAAASSRAPRINAGVASMRARPASMRASHHCEQGPAQMRASHQRERGPHQCDRYIKVLTALT